MRLKDITKVSELLEILEWDLDGSGLAVTDYNLLAHTVAVTFPELDDDVYEEREGLTDV